MSVIPIFVDAIANSDSFNYEEVDRIPGTSKIRTYVCGSHLFKEDEHHTEVKNPYLESEITLKRTLEKK